MVTNAKQFNVKGSSVYEDAERVRKTASNFMVKHNPAYKNPNYVAVATPLPEGASEEPESVSDTPIIATTGAEKTHSRRSSRMMGRRKSSVVAEPEPEPEPEPESEAIEDDEGGEEDAEGEEVEETEEGPEGPERFRGKTFQDAQDLIIDELINYTEYAKHPAVTERNTANEN
jgi:hypothetical protein